MQPVLDALAQYAGDLVGALPHAEVHRTAALIALTVDQCERAHRGTAALYVPEAVAKTRTWAADHPGATPERLLAQVQLHVTWLMGRLRDRSMKPLTPPPADPPPGTKTPALVRW